MAGDALSWGRYPRVRAPRVLPFPDRHGNLPDGESSLLPYGNGRSYGDSCLNDGGALLRARQLDRFIAFDPATGILECEAGMLLAEVLDRVVPSGWFVPVTPGTRLVTLGGAIANDVHGKNHHGAGTFGRHVLDFDLLRSDRGLLHCSPTSEPELFAATVGGLGLTGLITRVRLQLRRIDGPWMITESIRFRGFDEFFALSAKSAARFEYTVAWVDFAAKGKALGRGLFSRANHAPAHPLHRPAAPTRRLVMPFIPPLSLVNRVTLRAFNTLYYHRQRRDVAHATTHYEPYFYPLDGIGQWNRMYGPKGFVQYQCVVPPADAPATIARLAREISAAGGGSFLAVLKQFGDLLSPGMLSFPRAGTTLALDFPFEGTRTLRFLDRLDDIVGAAGGAVYPAKDARMSGARFRQYFPAWQAFAPFIDPRFSSSFWRRVES
jgi:FAD/FMN-containing dehydrogenase